MKRISLFCLFVMVLFAGNAWAATLDGDWTAINTCIGGNYTDPANPQVNITSVEFFQVGMHFTALNAGGELCGGIIDGKSIYLTCPPQIAENPDDQVFQEGTVFQGILKGQNEITGVNHVPQDGKTCFIEVLRD